MSEKRLILSHPGPPSEELHEHEDAYLELETKHKVCTGQRVFERDRKKYNLVVEMLSQQLPVRHIAKVGQMSFSTISAIRRHAGLPAETEKDALTETIRCAARVVAERVLELGDQMSPKEASISLGILTDKLQILSGEPNFISANRSEQALTHQEWNLLIESLPQATAQVIEVSNRQQAEEAPKP